MKTEMKELNLNELEMVNGGFKIPILEDIKKKLQEIIEGQKDRRLRVDQF